MKTKSINILLGLCITAVVLVGGILISNKISEARCASRMTDKIVNLRTVEPGQDFTDLKPLETVLKNKKIVSIGEGTHGTKEFFQMKHRMFEFLVEDMGYRLFAMEAGFGDAQVVNDYILNGKGNVNEVVKELKYWTWKTEEVAAMVDWMKEYNLNPQHKTKIKFYGFDIQSTENNKKIILNYLKTVDEGLLNKYSEVFNSFNDKNFNSFDNAKKGNIKNSIEDLAKNFESKREQYITKSSEAQYELMQHNLTNILEYIGLNTDGSAKYAEFRDKHMADNVRWILDYEKQFGNDKIMLWAHNGHVNKEFPTYTPMGSHLSKIYGDDMYTIALEFNKGNFRAYPSQNAENIKEFKFKDSSNFYFAHKLKAVNTPIYFMDFKQASQDKYLEKWLSKPAMIHQIGAVYSQYNLLNLTCWQIPSKAFDGVIFIESTAASVGIK